MPYDSRYIPVFIAILAFLAFFLLLLAIVIYFSRLKDKSEIRKKIKKASEESIAPKVQTAVDTTLKFKDKLRGKISHFIGTFGKRVAPMKVKDYSQMRPMYLKAGFRRENAPAVFWGFKCILAIGLPACFFLLRVAIGLPLSTPMTVGICVYLSLLGLYLPNIWLRIRIARRRERLFKGFPDALDLLVVCVEAGMGIDAAIRRVGEEIRLTNETLSDELRLLNMELKAGKLRRDALKDLAMRTDLEDVESLATLLIQTDKFGTNVAEALRVYSDMFRTKRYQRAEEIAAKIPVKLAIPLGLFIFPSLFVVILGPALISIFKVLMSQIR